MAQMSSAELNQILNHFKAVGKADDKLTKQHSEQSGNVIATEDELSSFRREMEGVTAVPTPQLTLAEMALDPTL